MHERVVVLDAALEQELVRDVRELPPRGDVPGRALARDPLDEVDALVEDGGLLLAGHRDRVLVRVAVDPDLVAGVDDLLVSLGERLDRVPGDEPGRPEAVLVEQLSSRGVPTSPAKRPREMSSGESSPPYEPSQPATASTSTPYATKISLAIAAPPVDRWYKRL